MVSVRSWGRLSCEQQKALCLIGAGQDNLDADPYGKGLAFGMGRSYGDICLNPGGVLWLTRGMDKFQHFDPDTGELEVQCGVLLGEIQALMSRRGWMLPVTPGSQYVTVGGAIANDVHGKNHHSKGCFGNHVSCITVQRTDGEIVRCSREENSDFFNATISGMGLTGVILAAVIKLRRVPGPWLETEAHAYNSLEEFFRLSDESEAEWEYTVSWIDCTQIRKVRGIFIRGNHVQNDAEFAPGRKWKLGFTPPFSLINRFTLRHLNRFYYAINKRNLGRSLSHYQQFFYPLDAVTDWNRVYGPRGFYQYQLVVPKENRLEVVRDLLDVIGQSGQGSCLSVLKTFGRIASPGMLSFPHHGVTLALDFPNSGSKTLTLFDRLDRLVLAAGGRLYPAKDARMSAETFVAGFPNWDQFQQYRDPGISSAMSSRFAVR